MRGSDSTSSWPSSSSTSRMFDCFAANSREVVIGTLSSFLIETYEERFRPK
jgi:hypothetical protein